jgi:PAS domain S-box-containing protein
MSKSGPLWTSTQSVTLNYAVAVLLVTAAVVAGRLLDSFLDTAPFVSLFLCSIMLATWFGGVGPGLFATGLSILAFDYYFVSPSNSLAIAPKDLPRIVLFAITSLFVIGIIAAQRGATESLRRARDDLQTAILELERLNRALLSENAERQRAEKEIRRAERELRATIDTIPVMAASYRRDGSLDFVNQTWRDYTGLSLDSSKGGRWGIAIHPDDLPLVESAWQAHLAMGEPFQIEQRMRRADGEYRSYLISRVPLRDENGEVIRWYGAGYDIEDRKRAEDALRRSEAYLAEAQRLSLTGSFGWKVASREIFWSEETYRILGYDTVVKPTIELLLQRVHPDDLALVQKAIDRALKGASDMDVLNRLRMPGGSIKYVHVLAHAPDQAGTPDYIGALRDITAVRQAEDALHNVQAELAHVTRLTTLGELAASIAHDVSQPLTGIVTNGAAGLRWLDQRPTPLDEVRSSLESMIDDAKRASDVIQRIRALSKKTSLEKAQLDINDVIQDVSRLVAREVLSQGASLRLELAPAVPPVLGDRVQLQQVIINLVINGMQAMEAVAGRAHELCIRSRPYEAGYVLVEVEDRGIGIDPEDTDRLFNAFFTTKPDGMGMGLSICRSIVEAHGGRVWASGHGGPGATFQFTLPVLLEMAT